MSTGILVSHVQDDGLRGALLGSVGGHVVLFSLILLAADFCGPTFIEIGSGAGGGRGGEVFTVGLSDQLSGGAGMFKPSIVAQPQALAHEPEPEETRVQPAEPVSQETVFERPEAPPLDKPPEPPSEARRPPPPRKPPQADREPGIIPGQAQPGSGGASGGGTGSGGGFGGGVGVSIGAGTGGAGIDSWYVRQVEQRIGRNWLRSSLGQLLTPVRTTVSFEIGRGGVIERIRVEESSGIGSVDLAAERAVHASSPLPAPPPELRRRNIRFVAHFEYPPGAR